MPGESSPLSVKSVPLVTVVEPDTQDWFAWHVLEMLEAVSASCVEVFTVMMFAELVTDPVGPGVPSVLTVIGPDEKNVAGPSFACPVDALSVKGTVDPPVGSVTVGVGPICGWGAPKRLTLSW